MVLTEPEPSPAAAIDSARIDKRAADEMTIDVDLEPSNKQPRAASPPRVADPGPEANAPGVVANAPDTAAASSGCD